jgi:hypothetical protein
MFSEVEFLISIGIYWIPYHCSIIFEIIILFSKIGVWFTLLFRDDKIVVWPRVSWLWFKLAWLNGRER